MSEYLNDVELEGYFENSVDLNEKSVERRFNIAVGVSRTTFKGIKLVKSTRSGGKDRLEAVFKIIESDNPSMVVGNEFSVPYFIDQYNYGLKDLCRFVYSTMGLNSDNPAEQLTYKEVLSNAAQMSENTTTISCFPKLNGDGTTKLNKEGAKIVGYSFSKFEEFLGE